MYESIRSNLLNCVRKGVVLLALILCIPSIASSIGISYPDQDVVVEAGNAPLLVRYKAGLYHSRGESSSLIFGPEDVVDQPLPAGIHTWVDLFWTSHWPHPPLPFPVVEQDDTTDPLKVFTLVEEPAEFPSHTEKLIISCDPSYDGWVGTGYAYIYIPRAWNPPPGNESFNAHFRVCTIPDPNGGIGIVFCCSGHIEIQFHCPPPVLIAPVIGGGQTQRSTVKAIGVRLSEDVTMAADALSIVGESNGAIDLAGAVFDFNSVNFSATWTLPQSLPDDMYTATLVSSKITDSRGQNLDGNGNGIGGDDATFYFYRRFGDATGDTIVDCVDLSLLVARWLDTPSNTGLDADGDNLVNFSDFVSFAENCVMKSTPPVPTMPEGFVLIPAGECEMGDHHDAAPDALPVHAVNLDSFYMSQHEVTNQQYSDYLNSAYSQGQIEVRSGVVYAAGSGTDPYCDTTTSSPYSRITWDASSCGVVSGKANHPMVMVSWYGAVAYCNWRSQKEGKEQCYDLSIWTCNFIKKGYRLPTEAEWEYAARAGEHNPYYRYPWGDNIDGSKANYGSSGDPYETGYSPLTTPVGYYDGNQAPTGVDMANGYGLYDMTGNVWEWCNDRYSGTYYSLSPLNNPTGPTSGIYRVLRGGSWGNSTTYCRVATRNSINANDRFFSYGFRIIQGLE